MSIYLVIVAATLILGAIMPQKGPRRKYYIILMAVIHAFVCGFRYQYLTGDLMKYQGHYASFYQYGWFSEEVWQEGRNGGFNILMKLIAQIFDNQFQPFLVITAIIGEIALAIIVYRYSPEPWMSYLVWNCMGFYIFGFSAVKQALAMAFVMLAFIGISEKKPKFFLSMVAIAGLIHMPALIFLPAYGLAQIRVNRRTIVFYLLLGFLIYIFKEQFIAFISSFYYDEDEVFVFSGEIGNRFIMLLGFTSFGAIFTGFDNPNFEKLFHLMAIATILQMLSGFDNIFTRLTDYYFQFSVLYIPLIFFQDGNSLQRSLIHPLLPFNKRSLKVLAVLISVFMLWFYYTYNINITIAYETDNYLNFRFMWDVQ